MVRNPRLWLYAGGLLIALSLIDLVFYAIIVWVFARFAAESDEFRFEADGMFLGVSAWYIAFKAVQDLLAVVAGALLMKQGWRAPPWALKEAAMPKAAAKSIGSEPE